MIDEVDVARVVERSRVRLEPIREPAEDRRLAPSARAFVLGDELVRALSLGDVEAGARDALHALAEHAGHEHRVVADVPADQDLVLRLEGRRVLAPDVLDLEQHVDHALEPRQSPPARIHVLGAGEAGQQIGQVLGRGIVAEREVPEARSNRAIEEV